ncbi:MAG: ABC transporter substrate binding protein [Bermanella sp.]
MPVVMRIVFVCLLLLGLPVLASQEPSVLLLNSYHPQYRWTDDIVRGVKDVLAQKIHTENLHIEYMDSRRFVDDLEYELKLIALLKHKYRIYEPEVIITSDDHAYDFMVKYGEDLFPGVPIVFCGVNIFKPSSLVGRTNITGIKEGMEIEGNLELIMRLQPDVRKIIMLADTTGLGLRMGERAEEIKKEWLQDTSKKNVTLDLWDHFSLDDLYESASQMTSDSVFLMLAIHKDKEGKYFSFDAELPILAQKSKVPIYGMWGALLIGNGVIGGMMNNPYEHGGAAAKMALEIMSGKTVNQLPIQDKAKYAPFFDYDLLTQFNIDFSYLPLNSTVQNRPESLYHKYKTQVNSALALLVFLMIIISALVDNIRRRVKAQKALAEMNLGLESIVTQRTRDLDEKNRKLEAASVRLQEVACTDPLTGLGNRRACMRDVEAYLQRFKRTGKAFSMALLDVDYFKRINDTFGHSVGDEVLCALVENIKQTIRPSDRVYRWGGEEFLIALPDTQVDFANAVCERICANVHNVRVGNVGLITASIGVSILQTGDGFDEILQRADAMLYKAKNNGRDQVLVCKEGG